METETTTNPSIDEVPTKPTTKPRSAAGRKAAATRAAKKTPKKTAAKPKAKTAEQERLTALERARSSVKVVAFERLYKGELDVDYISQLLTCSAQGETYVPNVGWQRPEGDYSITPEEAAELGQLLALQGQLVKRAQALYERVRDAAVGAVSK